ncbi:MAG: hypothetical protein ACRCUT_01785, partial [Spirochaetota bacterium]
MKRIALIVIVLWSVPLPAQDLPYALDLKTDFALLNADLVLMSSLWWGDYFTQPYDRSDLSQLDKNSVNSIDRSAAGRWSRQADVLSAIGVTALMCAPCAYLFDERVRAGWL